MAWEEQVIGACRLIRGDASEVLPTLGQVDAVVTDPPYENMHGGLMQYAYGVAPRRRATMTVGQELGTAEALALVPTLARYGAIAFCSYHWIEECAARLGGERKALLTWYKRNSPPPINNVPWYYTEFAWAVQYAPGITWRGLPTFLDVPRLQAGCFGKEYGERFTIAGQSVHPAQKPLALMQALVLPGMESICDPYMGTGTTGVACMQLGRFFIGIEIEPRYFDIACRRIEEASAQPALFVPPVYKAQQLALGVASCTQL